MTVAAFPTTPREMHRAARFLALGGLAAGCNWASRFAWSLALPFGPAVIAAYATGMVVAFVLFRAFVFPELDLPMRVQIGRFVLVNLIGAALTWAVAMTLVKGLFPALGVTFHAEAIGHAIAIAAPTAVSWILHRRFTFEPPRDART